MRKVQQGFTLIELIMVIVIIGILASVAMPRFYDLQIDARKAKINALYGSMRSATAIVHAGALANNKTSCTAGTHTLTVEGQDVALLCGYPSAAGIVVASNIVSGQDGITVSTAAGVSIVTVDGSPDTGGATVSCRITYTQQAASANSPPTIATNVTGC